MFHAQSRLFAKRVINQQVKNDEIDAVLKAQFATGDALALTQAEDIITGAANPQVLIDETYRLATAFAQSKTEMVQDIKNALKTQAAVETKDLLTCTTVSQNDTILKCPLSQKINADKNEFLVAVHNQQATRFDKFVRILLPSNDYRAHVWSNQIGSFVDIEADVIEQKHWQKNGQQFTDYEMFLKTVIEPDEVLIVKVLKNATVETSKDEEQKEEREKSKSLQIQGVNDKSEVLFQYTDKVQNFTQLFGINIKKYLAHQVLDVDHINKNSDIYEGTEVKLEMERSEGRFILLPEFKTPLPQQFSEVNADVTYQKGNMIEQWTITCDNKTTEERALIKVLFSEHMKGLIEFNVELNTIPIKDDQGKDITVNFKMFNGFNPKG